MKNVELWQSYSEYTKAVSENARRLGYAAIAIAWVFVEGSGRISAATGVGLLGASLFFLLDLGQYMLAALSLRRWTRSEEVKKWDEEGTLEGEYLKPARLDRWPYVLWWAKMGVLLTAYGALAVGLINHVAK